MIPMSKKTLEAVQNLFNKGHSKREVRYALKMKYPNLENEAIEKYLTLAQCKVEQRNLTEIEQVSLKKDISMKFRSFLKKKNK